MSAPLSPDTVRHALLRADGRWPDVVLDGLEVLADGTIELRRVPALKTPHLHTPGRAKPSGLALDCECGLYVVDATAGRVVRDALDCPDRRDVEVGRLRGPAGIAVGCCGRVFVADTAGHRILVLSPRGPGVEAWTTGLTRPVAVAADGRGGLYVLDAGGPQVLRLAADGTPDATFRPLAALPQPRAIAAGADGMLYVAGGADAGVLRFTPAGAPAGPALAPGTTPQALAVGGETLYAADATTGEILLVSLPDGAALGAVAGFRGPVAALAADSDGNVYVKPGEDASYVAAQPRAGRVGRGTLVTRAPLDAGEDLDWLRVAADADVPDGTALTFDLAGDPPGTGPTWRRAAAPDTLLDPSRFLSLRLTLTGDGNGSSPVLRQVRAETPGDSYLRYLPAVYSRDRQASRTVGRLLALAKAELGDLESEIVLLPRRFRTATAAPADLERLADWLAYPVPEGDAGPTALRALLDESDELYDRRGTPRGLARAIEIHVGAEATVLEDFRTRGIWRLGSAALGFDTRVASTSADGLVVGSASVGASGPAAAARWGSALFADTAHRFAVVLPAAAAPTEDDRRRVRETVEREQPAHAIAHVCFSHPRLRAGVQARVGLDAIVAGPGDGFRLDGHTRLSLDTRTGEEGGR